MAHRCPDCTLRCDCLPGDAVTYHCTHCDDERPSISVIEDDDLDPEEPVEDPGEDSEVDDDEDIEDWQ